MGGCGPHNPCQPSSVEDNLGQQQQQSQTGSGGGCCSSRTNVSTLDQQQSIPIQPQPPSNNNIAGCCSGKSMEDTTTELSLMEMMDKLTNNPVFDSNKPESSGCGGGSDGDGACSCKDPNEGVQKGCCIVICLKTLETLKFLVMQKDALACKSSVAKSGTISRKMPLSRSSSSILGRRCHNNNTNNMQACCSTAAV